MCKFNPLVLRSDCVCMQAGRSKIKVPEDHDDFIMIARNEPYIEPQLPLSSSVI